MALLAGVLGAFGCGDGGHTHAHMHPADAAAAFAACPESIPELAPGLAVTGRDARIRAELLDASRMPARKYGNDWTLALTEPGGEPLDDVEITRLEAFMPVHGHYGRPDTEVEMLDDSGQVRTTIHFTMRGPWEVQLEASSASAGDDYLVFDVCVEE